jgi:hypothetical protein
MPVAATHQHIPLFTGLGGLIWCLIILIRGKKKAK